MMKTAVGFAAFPGLGAAQPASAAQIPPHQHSAPPAPAPPAPQPDAAMKTVMMMSPVPPLGPPEGSATIVNAHFQSPTLHSGAGALELAVPPPPQPPVKVDAIAAQASGGQTSVAQPLPPADQSRTMLGVVAPNLARSLGGGAIASAPLVDGAPRPLALPSDNRTMLGVMSPVGVQALPDLVPAPIPQAAPPPPAYVPPAPEAGERPTPRTPKKRGIRLVPLLLGLGALVAVFALVMLLLWKKPSSLVVALSAKPSGGETLKLTCTTCEDGTHVSALGAEGSTAGGKVELDLKAPLPVGDNLVEIRLSRPKGREEVLKANVPVFFRGRALIEEAFQTPPKLVVQFDARPGASVTVMDQPLTFDANGRARIETPLAAQATGPANEWASIATDFRYVGTSGGQTVEGSIPVKLKVVPVRFDAPGTFFATSSKSFFVSGQTVPGATVALDGTPVDVSPQGGFAKELTTAGRHELVTTLSGVVPRTVPFEVRTRKSLSEENADCAKKAKATLEKGQWIAVDAKRVQSRLENHATVLVVELSRGCSKAPCTARVLLGGELGPGPRLVGCARYLRDTSNGEPELEAEWLEAVPAGRR